MSWAAFGVVSWPAGGDSVAPLPALSSGRSPPFVKAFFFFLPRDTSEPVPVGRGMLEDLLLAMWAASLTHPEAGALAVTP